MNVHPTKIILIAVVTALLILLAAPTIAIASMEMTPSSCDTNPLHTKPSIPICCVTADCLLSHCSLSNAAASEVLLPSRSTLDKNVHIGQPKTSVSTETSPDSKIPQQREPSQESPPHLNTTYHCRNSLDSEEPPQV